MLNLGGAFSQQTEANYVRAKARVKRAGGRVSDSA